MDRITQYQISQKPYQPFSNCYIGANRRAYIQFLVVKGTTACNSLNSPEIQPLRTRPRAVGCCLLYLNTAPAKGNSGGGVCYNITY